ncbi:hypothetical protein AB0J74_22575 [Asanoa sp. NPDC049573]|uniref:hypothetical protein n=1 Tax=Asanoa sp. NPDC049573 TaxID=3155396 RepID=UPI003424E7FE
MDDELFDEAVAAALSRTEIVTALERLSQGRTDRRRPITQAVIDHLRALRPGMATLATAELEAYERAAAPPVSESVVVLGLDDARAGLLAALVERAVLPAIREWINEELERDRRRRYRLRFDTTDTSGLRQMSAPEHELATDAFTRLRTLMGATGGGAIGISGPRGVGKSTLIRSVCDNPRWFGKDRLSYGVAVPAPVEYVPRDFLLHLFASLCLRVDPRAQESIEPAGPPAVPPFVITFAGVLTAVAGLVLLGSTLTAAQPAAVMVAGLALVAAVAGGLAVLRHRLARVHFLAGLGYERAGAAARSVETRAAHVVTVLAIAAAGLSVAGWLTDAVPGVDTSLALGAVAVAAVLAVAVVIPDAGALTDAAVAGAGCSAALLVATAVVEGPPPADRRLAVVLFVVALAAAWSRGIVRRLAPPPAQRHALHAGLTAGAVAALAGGLAATAGAAWNVAVRPGYAWAAVLVATSFGLATALPAGGRATPVGPARPEPGGPAREQLRRIRYQQTVTTGWSDAVKIGAVPKTPVALERTVTGGTALARVPLTYPEIVGDFHAYVRELTRSGAAVVIGIDELDKLQPEAAVRFMNEVKAVIEAHVPGCYFLVSISEEALAGFEQRGLPTRDVFDTAFDEMLRLDHLRYESTVAMLAKRVIDLPRGVVALSHALAGGLPRDVVRAVRAADAARRIRRAADDGQLISEVARRVCADELRSRLHGLRTEARALGDWRLTMALTDWANQRSLDDLTDLGTPPKEIDDTTLLLAHATSVYHLATVAAFFATAGEVDLERVETDGIDTLAQARADMAVSWALAWRGVSAFRAAWGMPVLDPPAG